MLGLVLGALLLAYTYPVRVYLKQQAQIDALQAAQAAQRQRIAGLKDEAAKWNDPAYVESQAHQLGLVAPGSKAFIVGVPAPDGTTTAGDTATGPVDPWYDQLWISLKTADGTGSGQ